MKAIIKTSKGDIEAELFADKAPMTVANFVNLATKGFYKNMIFYRVIPNFMIETGDPTGKGIGGPGYKFDDEFHRDLRHDSAGILSMGNSGSNTNGSRFFITLDSLPFLNNKNSIFGKVTKGLDVINLISENDKLEIINIEGDIATLMETYKREIDFWNHELKKYHNI